MSQFDGNTRVIFLTSSPNFQCDFFFFKAESDYKIWFEPIHSYFLIFQIYITIRKLALNYFYDKI